MEMSGSTMFIKMNPQLEDLRESSRTEDQN